MRENRVEYTVQINGSFAGKFKTTTRNRPKQEIVDEAASFLNDLQKKQLVKVVHIPDKVINFQLCI